jgi:hypothetical protein
MRYTMHVVIHRLDGTQLAAGDDLLRTQGKLLDAIAYELRKHEDFAASLVFTVVIIRGTTV